MGTKITVVSDLHLEMAYQELPGGDVLVLSGDICEARSYASEFRSTRLVEHTPGTYTYTDFFEVECAKYKQVFYVMGNHEFYRGRFDKTADLLRSMLPSNVQLLDKDVFEYDGIVFMGATMWTDMNKNDPVTLWTVKSSMSDFRVIQNHYVEKGLYHKLLPETTVAEHRKTLEYFKKTLDEFPERKFVIMTHHAPSHLSIDPHYIHETTMNGAYVSDLSEFILDHPQIALWTHGHVHSKHDYVIGDTRIVCNPRGYVGYENTSQFDPFYTVEI
jgi:Icc-related predicted phosphoesterase